MAGRPGKDSPARIDPRTGRPLPEGIRWRADRQRYQIRVVGPSAAGGADERSRMFLTLAEAKRELAKAVAGPSKVETLSPTRMIGPRPSPAPPRGALVSSERIVRPAGIDFARAS